MINEELRTFIAKMRSAGKTDPEIAAELKTAGWDEKTVNQKLSVKFGFSKLKFWILLYGITILLIVGGVPLLREMNVPVYKEIDVVLITFAVVILPIFTLLAIFSGILSFILSKVFPGKNIPSISRGWLLVTAGIIASTAMIAIGVIIPVDPAWEIGNLLLIIIPTIGILFLILSFIVGVILGTKAVLRMDVSRRKSGWIVVSTLTLTILIALFALIRLVLAYLFRKVLG